MPSRSLATKVVRSSDVPKPRCPWCGSGSSGVIESRGDLFEDVYRRRRCCLECARQWFTIEALDVERFERYLAAKGLTLADLGLPES